MTVLTLDEIKTQLRMELDDSSRDAELTRFEAAAIANAEQFIGRSIPWNDALGVPVEVPESVKQALLIMVAEFDQMREASVVGTTYTKVATAENMLHFYRIGMGI